MPATTYPRFPGRPADFVCPTIADAEAVATLPWVGNFASDQPLFAAVMEWVIDSAPTIEAAKRALYLSGKVGMGLDDELCEVTDDQLFEVCSEEGRVPVHYSIPGFRFGQPG